MSSVLVLDPGESTGWVYSNGTSLVGGTLGKNHQEVAEKIIRLRPDVVVIERFNLYPGMAKSLSWNSFYPVEVIGVVKYVCDSMDIDIVEQAPSVKKYAGGFDQPWEAVKDRKSVV